MYNEIINEQIDQGRRKPVSGLTYTTAQIVNELALADSPSLSIRIDGTNAPMQTSHITQEQLLSVPGMADRRWRYSYTTHEWIPLFTYCDERDYREVVDVEPSTIEFFDGLWVTPKTFPRPQ